VEALKETKGRRKNISVKEGKTKSSEGKRWIFRNQTDSTGERTTSS